MKPGLCLESGEFVPADELNALPIDVAVPEQPSPFDVPAMGHIARRKLGALVADGHEVCGVMIQRVTAEGVQRGAVSAGGMVIWWTSPEDIVRLEERIIERERARIKDGIMALTLTAEKLPTDKPDVDAARKALALRITTLVDGRGDLVLTDAGQRMLQLHAPAGVTVAAAGPTSGTWRLTWTSGARRLCRRTSSGPPLDFQHRSAAGRRRRSDWRAELNNRTGEDDVHKTASRKACAGLGRPRVGARHVGAEAQQRAKHRQ